MKVPAQYVGDHEKVLAKFGGPYQDAQGKPLSDLHLRYGDTLMLEAHEVYGHTMLHDPRHEADSRNLGLGRVVLEEHAGKSDEELSVIGYEFHQPREDFEALKSLAEVLASLQPNSIASETEFKKGAKGKSSAQQQEGGTN